MKITVTLEDKREGRVGEYSLDLPEREAIREFYRTSESINEALRQIMLSKIRKLENNTQKTSDINVPVVNKQENKETAVFIEKRINEVAKKIKKEDSVKEECTFKSVPQEGYISKKLSIHVLIVKLQLHFM